MLINISFKGGTVRGHNWGFEMLINIIFKGGSGRGHNWGLGILNQH
jgi:hypothetical protein